MRTCSARWDLSNDVSFMLCHSWRLEVREELTWQCWETQDWVTNQVTCHLPIYHQHRHIINDTSFDRSHRAEHVLIVHFVQLSTLLMHCSHIIMHEWWWCWIDDCASSEWRMGVKATHILIDLIELHTNIMSFSLHSQFSWSGSEQ